MILLLKRLLGLVVYIATGNRYNIATLIIVFNVIAAWIIGIQMRRKIRRDLGRKATDADLTSIDTWMKVDEVEERNKGNKPLS